MNKLGEIFIKAGLITEKELETALKEKDKTPTLRLGEILVMLNFATDKEVAMALSAQLGMQFVDLSTLTIDPALIQLIPAKLANKYTVFAVEQVGKTLRLAMADPLDLEAIQFVQFKVNCQISPVVAAANDIRNAIERYYQLDEDIEEIIKNVRYNKGVELIDGEEIDESTIDLKKKSQTPPIVRIVNMVMQKAARMNASDIHIEPQERIVNIRYRIDGIMHHIMQLPKWLLGGTVSRIKIMASLDIAERRLPQDGKIKMKFEGRTYDVRISTLPTKFGEKVVMRLLNTSNPMVSLDEIGLLPAAMRTMLAFSELKQGLVLITGPTGSGKTTTLYAFIKEVLRRKLNIITFEDPIEYMIAGVNQVQINEKAGLTFAQGLRSALRQDPDVIMVGEIRDRETLEIALQAGITGHLVLSTVHTNDAVTTVSRLKHLGAEGFQLSAGLCGVVAQRLVRTICSNCKEQYEPSPQLLNKLQGKLGGDFPHIFYRGKGCDKCAKTGYRNRLGVYEVLAIDNSLQSLIVADAPDVQLREKAIETGMVTMAMDCIDKVRYGITTLEELERVFVLEDQLTEKCPNCERLLNPEFTICPYCSFVLSHICATCGKDLDSEWTICPYCRTEVGTTRRPSYPELSPPPPNAFLPAPAPPPRTLSTGNMSPPRMISAGSTPQVSAQRSLPAASTPLPSDDGQFNNAIPSVTPMPPQTAPTGQVTVLPADPAYKLQQMVANYEELSANILLLENDEILLIGLHSYLSKENFNVQVARDGFQALEQVLAFKPQLAVIDIMTMRMDGYEFIRALRQDISTTFIPIIILSAKDNVEDKLLGFTLGIDDYLDKPFAPEELVARIRAVLRRVYG
ncbi:MAG: ATPase, T2SS/T4P/T4SS family [Acidobacteriota bacterium]